MRITRSIRNQRQHQRIGAGKRDSPSTQSKMYKNANLENLQKRSAINDLECNCGLSELFPDGEQRKQIKTIIYHNVR